MSLRYPAQHMAFKTHCVGPVISLLTALRNFKRHMENKTTESIDFIENIIKSMCIKFLKHSEKMCIIGKTMHGFQSFAEKNFFC